MAIVQLPSEFWTGLFAAPWFVWVVIACLGLVYLPLVLGWWDMRSQRKEHTEALEELSAATKENTKVMREQNQISREGITAINTRLDAQARVQDRLDATLGHVRERIELMVDRWSRHPDR